MRARRGARRSHPSHDQPQSVAAGCACRSSKSCAIDRGLSTEKSRAAVSSVGEDVRAILIRGRRPARTVQPNAAALVRVMQHKIIRAKMVPLSGERI